MERERSVSLASDSSSLSMDSWSLADESADEARDRQQQHNVSSSSYRRTSSGTNLSLHDSHSSSFGEFSELFPSNNKNDDYDAEMESICSNEVQILDQQLMTELEAEEEQNLLQQLNDARKCEILPPPTLHAYEPFPTAAMHKNASEREEFSGYASSDQNIFRSPPVESTFTFLKQPGQRIRFSEKNDARYYVPDSYLTDEEEVRVRSDDDVNQNVHFTWPYQKILSSTSMPTIPLVVEETEDEEQQSVDWSARWGDEEDNSSDVLPSIPSSTTPSPQSSFSAADESELEANADEGDKSNILIKMEEDEEIIVESGKNDRKPIDNESESDESSEELAIVADSEPISFTHDGGCIIQQQQVENLASVKIDSPTIGNDDETEAEESGNSDLKGMERQHEIPAVAQSPVIIDAQFEEFELGSVISSSSDSDNNATMDTDNDSLTMAVAAEAVEEAKLKMEEDKSNSIATEMTKQWIPLESVVVVGSVAAGNALAFEGSDQTSAAAVETISVSDEKQLSAVKGGQSVESSFVEITVEKSEQNEFIQHEISMLAEAQLQNALSKSSSTTVMPEAVRLTTVTASKNPNNNHEFLLMGANGDGADEIGSVFSSSGGWSGASSFECCDDEANDTDDLFIVSSSSSDVQSTTSLSSIDSAERHFSVSSFESNNATSTPTSKSTSTNGIRMRRAKIRRSIEKMTTNDEPPLFEFNPFDLFDYVAAKVSSTWAKIDRHERIVIHCLLLALVFGCICSALILHSLVIGNSRMHYNRSHHSIHPRQQLRNGETMPIAFDSERFIDEQHYRIEPKESEHDSSVEDESENGNKNALRSGLLMATIRENNSQKSVLLDDDDDDYCFEPQKLFEKQSSEKVAKQSKWKNDRKKEQQTEILLIDQRKPLKQVQQNAQIVPASLFVDNLFNALVPPSNNCQRQYSEIRTMKELLQCKRRIAEIKAAYKARDEYFRLKLAHNKAAISSLRETVSSFADNHQQQLRQKNSLSTFVIAQAPKKQSPIPPITAAEGQDEGRSAAAKKKRLLPLKISVKKWMEVDELGGIKRPRYSIVENVVVDERKDTSLNDGDPTSNASKSISATNKVRVKKWRDVGSVWPRYTLEEEIDEQVDHDKNGREDVVSVKTEKANEPSSSLAHFVNASVLESAFNKSDADAMNNDDQNMVSVVSPNSSHTEQKRTSNNKRKVRKNGKMFGKMNFTATTTTSGTNEVENDDWLLQRAKIRAHLRATLKKSHQNQSADNDLKQKIVPSGCGKPTRVLLDCHGNDEQRFHCWWFSRSKARERLRRRDKRIEAFSSHETHSQTKLNRRRKFYDTLELNMPQDGDWFQQRQRQRAWLRRQEARRQRRLQKILARWHWIRWTVTEDDRLCGDIFDSNSCTMESYLCVEL